MGPNSLDSIPVPYGENVQFTLAREPAAQTPPGQSLSVLHFQRGRDGHAVPDRTGNGTVICMEAVDSLSHLPLSVVELKAIADVDPPDHQDISFLLDVATGLRSEPSFVCRDAARLQRASKGPR